MAVVMPAQTAPINIGLEDYTDENTQPIAVDVPQSDAPAPIDVEVAEKRASKIKYGLDEVLRKSKEEIFADLQQGKEGSLRLEAATQIDDRKRAQTEQVIKHVIGQKGGELTPGERIGITEIIANMTKATDPDSVFEEAYGKQFVGTLDRLSTGKPDSVLNAAKREDPARVAEMQDGHSSLITKREYLRKVAEDEEADLKNQGWGGWTFDLVKQAIPGYTDWNLRNVAGEGFFAGLGLGPNLEEARKTLLRLPFDEMKVKTQAIVQGLNSGIAGGNRQLAAQFARDMVEMSTDDVFLRSAVLPLDTLGIGIGKTAIKGLEAVRPASKVMQRAEKAITDVSREATNPNASKSTIEAAAGDLKESAVTRAVTNLTWETIGTGPERKAVSFADNVNTVLASPHQTTKAVEALPSALRTDLEDIKANPGRLGQDIVNRIEDSSNTITSRIMDAIKNIQRVERLPDIMTNETAVRAIQESIKGTYKTLKNSILDVSRPYKVLDNYQVDMLLGKNDGTYFESADVAQNFIEHHGLKSSDIIQGTDGKYTKRAVQDAKHTENITRAQKIIEREKAKIENKSLTDKERARAAEQVSTAEEYIVDEATARNNLRQTATVEQQGLGFYVKITKPINETDSVIRDFVAQTSNTKIPEGPLKTFLNSWLGKVRTPEEVLSKAERQNRLTATYTPSVLFDIMKDNAKTISKISTKNRFGDKKTKWDQFLRVLENGQQIKDPNSADEVGGYFFKSPGELEEKYLQWFNRLPDEDEIVAYFEFKRGMEIDRIFRNLAEHRNQQRVGAETHRIVTTSPDGTPSYSPEFSGVVRKTVGAADDNVLIMKEDGTYSIRSLQRMSAAEKKELLQDEIDKGRGQFIELYKPEIRPLNGWNDMTDTRVRYVFSKSFETRELDWNQVPRRGGGHIEYDYDYYVKQAKIMKDEAGSRFWYEGDTTVMPIQVAAMGRKVADHLNEVRKLLASKNEDGAREYSNKNLHISWDTVRGWFTAGPDANGKYHAARLSLDEPIHVVKKGESIGSFDKGRLETQYKGFKDGTREGSLARQSQVEFTTERDAYDVFTLDDVGTRGKPLYEVAQARLVDPITTMNRGLARIAKSNFLDDYKTMSVEHWLKQAEKYLRPTKSEIWHAPFHAFNEADFVKDTPADIKAALEASRYHTRQLTGTPSTTDALLHSLAQKTYDRLYENFGPKGLIISPSWMLPKLKDPFGFVRSVVFNMKLGLFNIPQFVVQAGNYANIYGIAGSKYATPGTYAAQLHFWTNINSNPAIINHLDELATRMKLPGTSHWKPGEFKEALEEGKKTGFFNVGNEYAMLDNPTSQKVISDGVSTFLDWGQYFFKQGEKNAKMGAWYTAYKEFRDSNPIGRLTNADRAAILQRADLLNVNMSRASSSAIHQGIWSIPTQFYTYQIRLMELFYGTRLTGVERARMLATNAALYGVPMAAGLTGAPVVETINKYAMENGYITGENFVSSLVMKGIPSMVGAIASGGGDFQKGTFQDVGNRFGTKGLEFLGNVNRGDKTWVDVAGGAAWSVAKSTWKLSDGMRYAVGAMIAGDKEVFPPMMEDATDVLKEISSTNIIFRPLAAINGARWLSKNEAYLADTSLGQAIFSGFTGLKDDKINDIQTMTTSIASDKEYNDNLEKMFSQEFKRAMKTMKDDKEQGHRQLSRAWHILDAGGYPEARIPGVITKALDDNQSILDKVTFDYYIRKAPDNRRMQGYESMKRIQDLKNKKKEDR